jgi:hypothetical protein
LSAASSIAALEQTIKKKAWLHSWRSERHALKIRNQIIYCI